MYDRTITQRAVEAASRDLGFQLRYHTQDQISAAIGHFNDLYDPSQRRLKRPLTPDEQQFITNERTLCALDFRNYWCNPPEAPIWMADHTFKPIGEIKAGDEVVGWAKADRPKLAAQFVRDHYTKATVISVMRRRAPLVEVVFESGRTVRCTPDHLWANGRPDRGACRFTSTSRYKSKVYRYQRTKTAKPWTIARVGAVLRYALPPVSYATLSPELQQRATWLGGVYDGEGSFNAKGGLSISQDRTHNPLVCEAIAQALDALGFRYSRSDKGFLITGGFRAVARFLTLCRPVRRAGMEKYLFGQVLTQKDKIIAIKDLGEGEVVSLQTTTGNYVAWGYLSKNCTHYAWIVNWRKEPQRFRPNIAQNIVMDLWAEDEVKGVAIWMQQLKARRLGVSTISELNVTHRYIFQPYSNCVVASADPQKTIEMAGMIKYCFTQQPWWLTPTVNKIKHDIPVEIGENGAYSTLAIQAGNQFTGVARGSAPNIIHLSELCEWVDADELIDGALLPAIIDAPNVFGILESTGKGPGWWKSKWEQTKRDFDRGTSRIRPVFLPWFVGTDIYPSPADLIKRPIPPAWIPDDRTIKHAERARKYVLANPLLFKYVAKGDREWSMPRSQMWWREMGYQTARESKTLHIYLAEYCADDFEAFQVQQNPLIDQEIIIAYQERSRDPEAVYTIVGPEIPPALVAPRRDWDMSKPTITISTKELTPKYDVKYQLIPLRFEGYPTFDEQLKLLVWEWPQPLYKYAVGVDCSEGVGQDNAAIEIYRDALPQRECGQVAEWVSNMVTAFQLWPLTLALGCLYSNFDVSLGRRAQCRLAIETWTNGAACQNELQKRGWTNFHPMYYAGDSKRPKQMASINRIGVMTNAVLRAALQDLWLTCLKEEAIDIPSPYLVQEITTLENVNGKAQAMEGEHDDRWMGLGFPLLSLHQAKPPGAQYTRMRVSYAPGLAEDQGMPHPSWQPPQQASSEPFRPARRIEQRLLRRTNRGALSRYVNPSMPIKYR